MTRNPRTLMLTWLAAALLVLGAASAARAETMRFSFDEIKPSTIGAYESGGLSIAGFDDCSTINGFEHSVLLPAFGGSGRFLAWSTNAEAECGRTLEIAFTDPIPAPAAVRIAVKGHLGPLTPEAATFVVQPPALSGLLAFTPDPIERRTVQLGDWQVVTFRAPSGQRIGRIYVEVDPYDGPALLIDEMLVATAPMVPTVALVDAPAAQTTDRSATLRFTPNADAVRTTCKLDDRPEQPCSSGVSYDGLALGSHEVRVTAYDAFDGPDLRPPVVKWTVTAPQPTPSPLTDRCTAVPDGDGDGVADLCDTLGEPATSPLEAGVKAKATVLSGEVFVKLPAATGASGRRLAEPGFVPLKGAAVLPVGSTVDARSGDVQVITATGATAKNAPRSATSRIVAAIFQIRQRRAARRAKGSKKKLPPSPTQLILRNATNAVTAARCDVRGSRGVVRSLSATIPKGIVQVSGSASRATATKSKTTLRMVDRCDGTFTEVGAGSVSLRDLRRHKTIIVTRGRSYFVPGAMLRPKGR